MSILLKDDELLKIVTDGQIIVGGETNCIEGIKYDFRLGNRILFGGKQTIDVSALPETERGSIQVHPGELVYVMSHEIIKMPQNMKAELSHKRKIIHAGILLLGGFCVDPNYKGRLFFALYNLSTMSFPLMPGKKLIAAQFYRLEENEIPSPQEIIPLYDFPDTLVQMMASYRPASLENLSRLFEDLSLKVENLRAEIRDKQDWFEKFQGFHEKHEQMIVKISESLDKEMASRTETEKEFRKSLTDIQKKIAIAAALISIIVAIIVGAVSNIVSSYLLR